MSSDSRYRRPTLPTIPSGVVLESIDFETVRGKEVLAHQIMNFILCGILDNQNKLRGWNEAGNFMEHFVHRSKQKSQQRRCPSYRQLQNR